MTRTNTGSAMMNLPMADGARVQGGFTLVELMIAMVLGAIVAAAVLTSFVSQNRSYLAQDDMVEMQQNGRSALDMLTRDLRSAGFDPNNLGAAVTAATANSITFTREDDLPANGLETVTYSLFDAYTLDVPPTNDGLVDDLARQVIPAIPPVPLPVADVIAENISQLEFRYLDSDGNVLPAPIDLDEIRAIQISLLAVAANPDQSFTGAVTYTAASGALWGPFNDNIRRRLMTTTVQCRNLGL